MCDYSLPRVHHDALELADGRIIKLSVLDAGQRARVLQLPARRGRDYHSKFAHGGRRHPNEPTPAR